MIEERYRHFCKVAGVADPAGYAHVGQVAAAILTLAEVIQQGQQADILDPRAHAKAARAIADMTKDPRDIKAAIEAEKELK